MMQHRRVRLTIILKEIPQGKQPERRLGKAGRTNRSLRLQNQPQVFVQ